MRKILSLIFLMSCLIPCICSGAEGGLEQGALTNYSNDDTARYCMPQPSDPVPKAQEKLKKLREIDPLIDTYVELGLNIGDMDGIKAIVAYYNWLNFHTEKRVSWRNPEGQEITSEQEMNLRRRTIMTVIRNIKSKKFFRGLILKHEDSKQMVARDKNSLITISTTYPGALKLSYWNREVNGVSSRRIEIVPNGSDIEFWTIHSKTNERVARYESLEQVIEIFEDKQDPKAFMKAAREKKEQIKERLPTLATTLDSDLNPEDEEGCACILAYHQWLKLDTMDVFSDKQLSAIEGVIVAIHGRVNYRHATHFIAEAKKEIEQNPGEVLITPYSKYPGVLMLAYWDKVTKQVLGTLCPIEKNMPVNGQVKKLDETIIKIKNQDQQ